MEHRKQHHRNLRTIHQAKKKHREETTHKDGRRLRRCRPDTDTDPRGSNSPDDVPTQQDHGKADEVEAHHDREPGPGVADVVFGVLGGVRQTERDAASNKGGTSATIVTAERQTTDKSEYGNMSDRGRIIKNRSGAWMSPMSKGRLYVGAWYTSNAMLEYTSKRTMIPSKTVETRNMRRT